MDGSQTRDDATGKAQPALARQLAAAMKRGTSALIVSPAGVATLLAETAVLLGASRIRVLQVRPPYNLTSFMQQIAPSTSEEDGSLLEGAYNALAVLDPACDRIALLADDAHLMPNTTLRYIESALRSRPHICVALAGKPELSDALASDSLSDLRERLSLNLVLASAPMAAAPVAAPARRRGLWVVGGLLATACVALIALQALGLQPLDSLRSGVAQLFPTPADTQPGMAQAVPAPAAAEVTPPSSAAPSGLKAAVEPPAAAAAPAEAVSTLPKVAVAAAEVVAAPAAAAAPDEAAAPPPKVAAATTEVAPEPPVVAVAPPKVAAALPLAAAVQPVVAEAAVVPAVLEPAMLALSGGEFRMGSNDDPSERPPHAAVLDPFLLAKHAVTVREWQQCVDAKACPSVSKGKPDEPVRNVSWDDARVFAAWLAKATMHPYRLPTEAEWEYAARAGTSTRYAWGNAMLPGRMSCKGCGEAVSLQSPPNVDAYPPNAFGLHGMGGGAAEWVSDCWHRNYQGAPRNGSMPWDAPNCRERVLRGGSWMEEAGSLRVSSRESYDASVRYPTHGFRVAQSR